MNGEAAAALATEPDLYQRGGMLVQVTDRSRATSAANATVRRPTGGPVVRDLPPALLRERLTRCARWVRPPRDDEPEQQEKQAHPPAWCVNAVHVRGDWPQLRRLEAVVTHPVLLGSGSLLATSGYDPDSELLVCIPPSLKLEVSGRPTRDEVHAAVATLLDVVADFPFASPAHRAAWVAALLTPLAWFAFADAAPMLLVDGNVRGVGKGLLADVIALILTGRRFPVMSYTSDREELRKKITSLAVEGERLVLLDNLSGPVGNDVLDGALTTDRWRDRLLGGNRNYEGPLHVCWFATGNNVQLQADTARRVLHCRMESAEERPELRMWFKYPELRAHVLAHRGRLLSAALVLLRGWVVAGRPQHGLPAWGSYDGWSGVVREAVVFARLPDPGETREALQTTADRDAVAMGQILYALRQMDPHQRGLTTSDIINRVRSPQGGSDDLRGAIEDLCGKLEGRALGGKFRHFKRRNFGGVMLDAAGTDRKNSTRWVVVSVSGDLGQGGSPHATPASPERDPAGEGYAGDDGAGSPRAESVSRDGSLAPEEGTWFGPTLTGGAA